jgi:hypothetical protein
MTLALGSKENLYNKWICCTMNFNVRQLYKNHLGIQGIPGWNAEITLEMRAVYKLKAK